MNKNVIISVIGGDARQVHIADRFGDCGYTVRKFGIDPDIDNCKSIEEALFDCDLLLLPLPLTRDGYRLNSTNDIMLTRLAELLPMGCKVLGGKIPPRIKDYFESCGIEHYDYFEDNNYVWRNADITAEGAVSMLMRELDITVFGAKLLVTGYGRIGKCLSGKLKALGAVVTVAARKAEDRILASIYGGVKADSIDYCRRGIFDIEKSYDAILNTVPSWIFDSSNASILQDKIYIELASPPYGGEPELLKKYCKKYILASGIPGKYAPISAAEAIFLALPDFIGKENDS